MPNCKFCHKEITKFDTDICPHCGAIRPIDPNYKTMDITKNIKTVAGDFDLPKTRSQKVFGILCMTLGWLGIHDFYIYLPKRGLAHILVTLIVVLGIGLPVYFAAWQNVLAILIPLFVVILAHVPLGYALWKIESPRDGRGEFLR